MPGQPGDRAGLKAYDVVTKVGGRHIATNSDFQKAVRELDPDTSVKVEFLRDGKAQSTTLMLGDLERDIKTAALGSNKLRGRVDSEGVTLDKVGLQLSNITSNNRTLWSLGRKIQGVIVSDVASGSPADEAGIARGDIILEIQKQKVGNAKAVQQLLAKPGSYILKVMRGNSVALFTLKI